MQSGTHRHFSAQLANVLEKKLFFPLTLESKSIIGQVTLIYIHFLLNFSIIKYCLYDPDTSFIMQCTTTIITVNCILRVYTNREGDRLQPPFHYMHHSSSTTKISGSVAYPSLSNCQLFSEVPLL